MTLIQNIECLWGACFGLTIVAACYRARITKLERDVQTLRNLRNVSK